ncbi:MAG TPA: DUF805 domain-containing protein [Pseudobacteroides sp.]|uniref:DUF805 domain-containing protein n=1 Tax=Pseudobacteroides sp. TaxID=1968840 RepID=UPI002F925550
MEWYLKVLKNYVNFSRRARRKEYWMFELFNISIMLALYILDLLVSPIFKSLYLLYTLAVFLPTLGVIVRRLHDIG